jgi:hypothetical protein
MESSSGNSRGSDDQHLGDVLGPEDFEDERLGLDVILADPTAAEPAHPDRTPLAVPTVHD